MQKSRLQDLLNGSAAKFEASQTAVEKLQAQCTQLRMQNTQLEEIVHQSKADIAEFRSTRQNSEGQIASELEASKQSLGKLQLQYTQVEDRAKAAEERAQAALDRAEAAENNAKATEDRAKALDERVQAADKAHHSAGQIADELVLSQREVEKLKAQCSRLEEQNKSLEMHFKKSIKELEDARKRSDEAKGSPQSVSGKVDKLRQQKLEARCASLENENEELQKRANAAEQKLQETQRGIDDLKSLCRIKVAPILATQPLASN